jgi:hypothetical protein
MNPLHGNVKNISRLTFSFLFTMLVSRTPNMVYGNDIRTIIVRILKTMHTFQDQTLRPEHAIPFLIAQHRSTKIERALDY